MIHTVRHIVNPKSGDGSTLYMKCVDGKHRGKHFWVSKGALSYTVSSAKLPRNHRYTALYDKSNAFFKVKYTQYFVKTFAKRNSDGSDSVCYYLSSVNTPEFEDFVRILGPKEVENGWKI